MQFRRNLPGRGSTDFYFTEESAGGMTTAQQEYIADLVMAYREKYPDLAVNAVWDFGMEEGDPVRGEKYGVFADSRDNAVYNASMLTISFNHARLRRMPLEIPEDEFTLISSCLSKYRDLPETASRMQADLLTKGVPWPKIDGMILENLGINLTPEQMKQVTERVVELGDKKESLSPEDLPFIVADVLKGRFSALPDRIRIVNYTLQLTRGMRPIAHLRIDVDGQEYEESAAGDGQYDAFMKAVWKIYDRLGRSHPTLTDYVVKIPPGGKTDALVETTISWDWDGHGFKTRGVDSDQTEAAIKATFKMLNLIENKLI